LGVFGSSGSFWYYATCVLRPPSGGLFIVTKLDYDELAVKVTV
jgi:hypothetical protein